MTGLVAPACLALLAAVDVIECRLPPGGGWTSEVAQRGALRQGLRARCDHEAFCSVPYPRSLHVRRPGLSSSRKGDLGLLVALRFSLCGQWDTNASAPAHSHPLGNPCASRVLASDALSIPEIVTLMARGGSLLFSTGPLRFYLCTPRRFCSSTILNTLVTPRKRTAGFTMPGCLCYLGYSTHRTLPPSSARVHRWPSYRSSGRAERLCRRLCVRVPRVSIHIERRFACVRGLEPMCDDNFVTPPMQGSRVCVGPMNGGL